MKLHKLLFAVVGLVFAVLLLLPGGGVRGEEIFLPDVRGAVTSTATSTPDLIATDVAVIQMTLTALVPTETPTPTGTATNTPTPTSTATATSTATPTTTSTPTNTATPDVVQTVIAILTSGAPTWTSTPTSTATFVPTAPAQ